ncbi:cytochrome c biogenesis CcdA family protein [Candidatus Margulisiibacteriota bacterium]
MNQNLNLLVAFTAGLLAFFSPCFLPLVPAYLIYITGLSFEEVKKVRLATIIHSLLFIFGFTFVFTSLGLLASVIGQFFYSFADIIRIVGGGFVILLGLYLMGHLKLPFLDIDRRITISSKPAGYLGTVFVGMVFALAWTPCIGPILTGILIYASQTATIAKGTLMLIAFSLGLGVPLFIFSLLMDYSLALVKKIDRYLKTIHFVSGLLMIILGLLLITNYFQTMIAWLIQVTGYQGI